MQCREKEKPTNNEFINSIFLLFIKSTTTSIHNFVLWLRFCACKYKFLFTMRLFLASALCLSTTTAAFVGQQHHQVRQPSFLFAKPKVFIDGEVGTTGLQVRERLEKRNDLEIISAPFDLRKDEATRKKLINEADCVILCTFLFASISEFSLFASSTSHTSTVLFVVLVQVSLTQPALKQLRGWNQAMIEPSSLMLPQRIALTKTGSMAFQVCRRLLDWIDEAPMLVK